MKHTINFEDLFDFEKESDAHYYKMLVHHQEWEESEKYISVEPVKIEVKHESNNATRKVRQSIGKRLKLRLGLSSKVTRTKNRSN